MKKELFESEVKRVANYFGTDAREILYKHEPDGLAHVAIFPIKPEYLPHLQSPSTFPIKGEWPIADIVKHVEQKRNVFSVIIFFSPISHVHIVPHIFQHKVNPKVLACHTEFPPGPFIFPVSGQKMDVGLRYKIHESLVEICVEKFLNGLPVDLEPEKIAYN